MTPRVVWFVAGTAAGVYASVKARRAAYRVSMPGLVDQASALGEGWRAFASEVRDGMADRERQVARQVAETSHLALQAPLDADDTDHPRNPERDT